MINPVVPINLGKHFDATRQYIEVEEGKFTVAQFTSVVASLHDLLDFATNFEHRNKPYMPVANKILEAFACPADWRPDAIEARAEYNRAMRSFRYDLEGHYDGQVPVEYDQEAKKFESTLENLMPGFGIDFRTEKTKIGPFTFGKIMTNEQMAALDINTLIIYKTVTLNSQGEPYFNEEAVEDFNRYTESYAQLSMDRRATVKPQVLAPA